MGQAEILKVLEKIKRPMGRREIADILKQDSCVISHHLKKLLLRNEIKCIEIDRHQAKAFFKENCASRRMKLYYL